MEREQCTETTWERKSGAHLTPAERGAIQSMHAQGMSQRKIAAHLNCSPSTITYELRRGTPERPGTRGPAPTDKARLGQQRSEKNRQRCRKRPAVLKCGAFLSRLKGRIRERKWSFDACVGHARRQGLFPQEPIPCAKTLYNALRAGLLQVSPFDLPLFVRNISGSVRSSVIGSSIQWWAGVRVARPCRRFWKEDPLLDDLAAYGP